METIRSTGRLRYIEPTDLGNNDGNLAEKISFPYEDYSIAVDLTVRVADRYSCGWSTENELKEINYSSTNGTLSFLGGSKTNGEQVLTTSYTDVSMTTPSDNTSECLGIESISITYNNWMYPQIVVKFVDVRGATVMLPSEYDYYNPKERGLSSQLYKSLFTFPYPMFILKVKGFYGKGTTFRLAVEKTNIEFNSNTGNFDITVSFIGFMYGIYADLPMTYVAAAPYMTGGAEYWKNNVASGRFKFRDKNGNPYGNMCTFPELKAKITEASKNEEVMSAASKGEEIAGSYDQQINAINAIKDAYPFDKNGWTLTKKASEYEGLSGENRAKVITFKNDNQGRFEEKCSDIANFYSLIKEYDKSFVPSVFSGCTNTNEFTLVVKAFHSLQVIVESNGIISKVSFYKLTKKKRGEYIDVSGKENEKDIFFQDKNGLELIKKHIQELKLPKGTYWVLYNYPADKDKPNLDKLNSELSKATKDKNQKKNEYMLMTAAAVEKIIGFKPSIKNIYDLVFAHMETFMYCFFEQTKKIKGELTSSSPNRKKNTYNLGKDETDTESTNSFNRNGIMDRGELLPPYFAYYGDDDTSGIGGKRKVAKWPGDLPNGMTNLMETMFVKDLLESCQLYNKHYSALNETAVNTGSGSTETEGDSSVANKLVYNFIPLTTYDIVLGMSNDNPYQFIADAIQGGTSDADAYEAILRTFMLRAYYVSQKKTLPNNGPVTSRIPTFNEMVGVIEAINVFKALSVLDLEKVTPIISKFKKRASFKQIKSLSYGKIPGLKSNTIFNTSSNALTYNEDFYPIGDFNLNRIKSTICNSEKAKNNPNFVSAKNEDGNAKSFFVIEDDNFFSNLNKALSNEFTSAVPLSESGRALRNEYGNLFVEKNNKEIVLKEYGDLVGKDIHLNSYYTNEVLYKIEKGKEKKVSNSELKKVISGEDDGAKYYIKYPALKRNNGDTYSLFDSKFDIYGFNSGNTSDKICARAFLFLSSMVLNDAYKYNGIQRYNKKEITFKNLLLREGAFYWRKNKNIDISFPSTYTPSSGQTFYNDAGVWRSESDVLYLSTESDHDYKALSNVQATSPSRIVELQSFFEKWAIDESKGYKRFERLLLDKKLYKNEKYSDGLDLSLLESKVETNKTRDAKELQEFLREIYFGKCFTLDTYHNINNSNGIPGFDKRTKADIESLLDKFCKSLTRIYNKKGEKKTTKEEKKEEPATASTQTSIDNVDLKLTTYLTLKSLYDKWLCSSINGGQRWKLERKTNESAKSDFDNFIYVDTFYNDIGYHLNVNITNTASWLNNCIPSSNVGGGEVSIIQTSSTVYDFLTTVAQDCGGMLLALPQKFGTYGVDNLKEMFTPLSFFSDWVEDSSTFLFMYTYKPSEHLGDSSTRDMNGWSPDGLDLTDDETVGKLMGGTGHTIPAFGVTYGKQNQSIFKDIRLNTETQGVTEAGLAAQFNIASKGSESPRETTLYGQDLYKVFSNYSYKCTVSCMGNLQIMPMMYFQLNNVPLWKGGYQIIRVSHNITAGNVDTVFEGMRINRYAIPFGGDFVLTIKNDGSENGGSSTNDTSKTSNGGNTGGGNSSGGGSDTPIKIPDTFPRPDATLPYSSSVDFDASSVSKVSPIICITPSHGPRTQKKEEWKWSTKLVLKMIEIFKSEPSKYKFKNGKPYYKNVQRCNKDGQNTGKGYSMRETKSIINKYGSDKVVSLAPHWNGGGGNYYATYIAPKGKVREDSLKFANAMKAVVDEYLDGPLKEIFVDAKMARPRTNRYANQIINIEEKKGGDGAPRVNCACILTENWFADWKKGEGKKLLYDHLDVIARLNCDGIKRYLDQLG